jgi:hypothetical protein
MSEAERNVRDMGVPVTDLVIHDLKARISELEAMVEQLERLNRLQKRELESIKGV